MSERYFLRTRKTASVTVPVIKKRKATPVAEPTIKKSKILKKDDDVKVGLFGDDSCGELGQGSTGLTKINPTSILIDGSVKQVACGAMHTLVLIEDGKIYSFGCNDECALGRKTESDEKLASTPKLIDSIKSRVTKITAGDSHSAALTDKNEVYVWGNFRDENGSVGLTPECDGKPSLEPIQILPEIKFKDIASGANHILLADVDGNIYSFGVGVQGQLGRIPAENLKDSVGKPLAINETNRELFLKPQIVDMKQVDPQRTFVCDAVYAGNYSSFATNTDKKKNRLAGWGLNNYFQLGYKGQKDQTVQPVPKRSTFTCSTSMVEVSCGQHHTLFLTKTGRVHAAGRHHYGMLGLGKVDNPVCPAKSVDALKQNKIVSISAGLSTSFAVDEDGSIYSWGMYGSNLGHKTKDEEDIESPMKIISKSLTDKKVIAVSAGGAHTAIIIK